MSALEQIRKRPALVIGVLGLALLLFLFTGIDRLGDLFTDRDSAVKVDGEKIRMAQVSARAEQANRQNSSDDLTQVEEQMIQQMINEALFEAEYKRLGIEVTDQELAALFFGETANPYFVRIAQQYGFPNLEEFYKYASSNQPGAEQVKDLWDEMKQNAISDLRQAKFTSLLGAINVNKLDAKALYDDNARTANILMAKKDYTTVPDDEVSVSDDEIRDRYKRDKALYAIPDEQRLVGYILVNVTPSQDDYLAAQQEVESAIQGLKELPSTDAVSGNFNFAAETLTARRENIADAAIKNNLDDILNDTVRLVSFNNDTYTIAKLIDTYVTNDSVYCDMAYIDSTADTDSVISLLNAGTAPSELGEKILDSRENIGFSLIEAQNAPFREQLINATPGQYFILDIPNAQPDQPAAAVRVVKIPEQARIYEIAKITRKVDPSSATYNKLNEDLRTYIANNTTTKDFMDNAAEANYTASQTIVKPSSLSIQGLKSTAAAAAWAMNAKKGEVSEVYSDPEKTYLLALVVDDIYDNGYITVANPNVAQSIATTLRNEKKGEKLVADYAGKAKDVEGYADKMGTTAETLSVTFGQDYIRGFRPGDADMLANVAVAKEGELVGPFAASNGVVVFQITGIESHGRDFDFETDRTTVAQREIGALQQNLINILRANKNIKYNVQRFFRN